MRPVRVILRWTSRLAVVAVFVGSLLLNATMATLAPVAVAASGVAQRLLGVSAVETVIDKRTRNLQAERTRLKTSNRNLKRQVTSLKGDLARQGRRARRLKSAVDGPSRRVARRVFRSTARNVGSAGIEWVPIVGGLVAVGLTAMEVRDSCAIMDDMNALRRAAGFDPMEDDWFSRTCTKLPLGLSGGIGDMTVPTCRDHAKDAEAAMLEGVDTLVTDPPEGLREEAGALRAEIEGVCDCLVLNPGNGDRCLRRLGAAR